MPEFHVTWEIDIEADTHQDAAEKALAIQRDQSSSAVVFDVDQEGGGVVRIDFLDITDGAPTDG